MAQTFRHRPADTGRARAIFVRRRLGEELRIARMAAGLTQSQVAVVAGVTQSHVSAVERGTRNVSLKAACLLAASAGHELAVRLFPTDAVSLRDSGQAAMAGAIVDAAHPTWHAYLEMPVSKTDRRAADLVLVGQREVLHLEIERRLVDFQAQLRAATLKRESLATRFAQPVHLILVLPDRKSSRYAVRELERIVSRTMPVASARIRRAIASGATAGGDGILFWPTAAGPAVKPAPAVTLSELTMP
jgi:transcriptional regulator with XRE-family HTH domain